MSTSRQVCVSSRLATTISVNKKINRFFFLIEERDFWICPFPVMPTATVCLGSHLSTGPLQQPCDCCPCFQCHPFKTLENGLRGMALPTFITLEVKSLTRHSRPQPMPVSLASSFLLLSSPNYFHVSVLLKLLLLPQNILGCHLSCLYLPLLILFSLPEITVTSNSHSTFPKSQAATVLNHTSDSPISFLPQPYVVNVIIILKSALLTPYP